jgi:hypothetical protein
VSSLLQARPMYPGCAQKVLESGGSRHMRGI